MSSFDATDNKLVGRRCAIYFEQGPCFFRKHEKVKSAGGYFLGKVVNSKGRNNVTVRFNDTQEFDFNLKEISFVQPSSKDPNLLVLCNNPDVCIATLYPTNVVPGDLVEVNYDGSSWFRGRVAFVDTRHGTCDVAYDDGEYQSGIEIQNNLILLSKGVDNPSWLAGLTVTISKAYGQSKTGKISDIVEKGQNIMVVHNDNTTKAYSYSFIASAIFLNVRMQPDRKILPWPAPRVVARTGHVGVSHKEVFSEILVDKQQSQKESVSKSSAQVSLSRTQQSSHFGETECPSRSVRLSQRNVSYAEYDSDLDLDEEDLIEYNPKRKAAPRRKPSDSASNKDVSEDDSELVERISTRAKEPCRRASRRTQTQKQISYTDGHTDDNVSEDDSVEYIPTPTKASKLDFDTDGNVSEDDSVEYIPTPTKVSDQNRKTCTRARRSTQAQKQISYTDRHTDDNVSEDDYVENIPTPTKVSDRNKKRKTSSTVDFDTDDDVTEDDSVEYIPTPTKVSDRNKNRKTSSTVDFDTDDDVSEDDSVEYIPTPTKVSDRNKKRKTSSTVNFHKDSNDDGRNDHGKTLRSSLRNDTGGKAPVEDKKQTQQKRKRIIRRTKAAIKLGSCEEPTYFNIAKNVVEMGESESEVFLSSLDSSESDVGKCFLNITSMFHNRVPSAYHCKRLVDLLTFGPGRPSSHCFPDHSRMENALTVFRSLIIKHGLVDHIAGGLASDYVEEVMNQASSLYYTISSDESRTTAAALQRVGLTLHARACGMEIFEVLMKHQLRGCLGVIPRNDTYRSRPLVIQVLNYSSQGAKGALEEMARVYVKFWSHYSLFINGCFQYPPEEFNGNLLKERFDLVRTQANRLAHLLGQVLSYFCCLYGAVTHESLESVGYVLGNIIKKELESSDFKKSSIVSNESRQLNLQARFAMIVNLDRILIPDAISKLAEILDVVDQFNSIYGLLSI